MESREKCKRPKCPAPAGKRTTGFCQGHYRAFLESRAKTVGRRLGYVGAQPARDHLAALRATGLTLARISLLSGVNRRVMQRLAKQDLVNAETERKLFALSVSGEIHSISADAAKIDATGTRRRLQALAAMGYHHEGVADMLDMDRTNIWRLATRYKELVFAQTARDIDALFRKLQMTPAPPGRGAVQAINRAKRNGWAPPLAWDEDTIDNPSAMPDLGKEEKDWLDRYCELVDMGVPGERAAERLGLKWTTVQRRLQRRENAA